MACIPPCGTAADQLLRTQEVVTTSPALLHPVFMPNDNPRFADVWLRSYYQGVDYHADPQQAIKEADAMLARYKEIYTGA